MRLTRLAGGDCDGNCGPDDCPTFYLSDRDTIVVQGDAVMHADGMRLGQTEQAVEIPIELLKEAARALGR